MSTNTIIAQLSIDDWVAGLAAISEPDFTLENVQTYIRQHTVHPGSLKKFSFFSKGNYTRNLIFKNEILECMAICWEVGQASRVHNHRDQNCWMSAPIGKLRVQNFHVADKNAGLGTCHLEPTDIYDMDATHPAYVNPLEPVHQVLNLPEFNQRAVSVHIYSKPFDTCEIYQRERGTYSDVPLHYTSQYGILDPAEKLL
jgi:predicted metal-dependent enzyme (double-stranded beta helix superfamily)